MCGPKKHVTGTKAAKIHTYIGSILKIDLNHIKQLYALVDFIYVGQNKQLIYKLSTLDCLTTHSVVYEHTYV